jgi:hypothetical protein
MAADTAQAQINARFWARGTTVGDYAHNELRAVEAVLFIRYAAALGGRVLDLGCGPAG